MPLRTLPRRAGAAIAALALAAGACHGPSAPATRRIREAPQVRAEAGELRTIPAGTDHGAAARELGALLRDLYQRAFLSPLPAPRPSRSPSPAPRPSRPPSPPPTPVPRPPPGELFAPSARAALEASPDPWRPSPGARLVRGRVRFEGVAVFEQDQPVAALLEVTFTALGHLGGGLLRVTQRGQLYCERTEAGWRVFSYDVSLTEERQVPPPPPPAARPS